MIGTAEAIKEEASSHQNESISVSEHGAEEVVGAEEGGGHEGINVVLAAEPIFDVGPFTVTNALLVTWIASAILLVVAFKFSRNIKAVPGKFQAFLEIIFDGLLNFMDSITQDRKKTERFGPITLTIFFFVLVANWLEMFPGFESIFLNGIPLLRSPSSDFNLTLTLAIVAVISSHVIGVKTLGSLKHAKKYFSLNPINMFIGIIEIIGDFAKVLSFSLRLFGNIFAGSVLLLVIGFLVPWGAPLPFMGLEIIVGMIQALVFSVLTLVFMTMATEEQH